MQTPTSEDTICLCIQSKERWGKRSGENGHCQCQWNEKRVQPGDLSWREKATLSWKECSLSLRSRWQGWWPIIFGVGVKNGISAAETSQEADHANHCIGNGVGMACHCCYYNCYRHYPVKSKAAGLGMAGRALVRAGQGQTRDLDRFCLARWSKFLMLNRPGG